MCHAWITLSVSSQVCCPLAPPTVLFLHRPAGDRRVSLSELWPSGSWFAWYAFDCLTTALSRLPFVGSAIRTHLSDAFVVVAGTPQRHTGEIEAACYKSDIACACGPPLMRTKHSAFVSRTTPQRAKKGDRFPTRCWAAITSRALSAPRKRDQNLTCPLSLGLGGLVLAKYPLGWPTLCSRPARRRWYWVDSRWPRSGYRAMGTRLSWRRDLESVPPWEGWPPGGSQPTARALRGRSRACRNNHRPGDLAHDRPNPTRRPCSAAPPGACPR